MKAPDKTSAALPGKLRETDLFKDCPQAFEKATWLPLHMHGVDEVPGGLNDRG